MTTAEAEVRISYGPHPMCQHCFEFVTHCAPARRLTEDYRDSEACCRCGDQTLSGIRLRHDGQQLFHCPGHARD